jgi:hypothetical protein
MSDNILPTVSQGPQKELVDWFYANADYQPILSNWFTAKPYGFRFTPKNGEAKVMYLPIGPSNLSITTYFATNIVPTIYGTVEEHSPVRYYDIVIEGTTGMGPKFVAPINANVKPDLKNGSQKSGRSSFAIQQSMTSGFFSKTLSTLDKTFRDISALTGKTAPAVTGLQLDQTGYLAFHNLYRFFLKYKKDASGTDQKNDTTARPENAKHPLVFFNYKDNNEYNVAIRSFSLRRDKENPMLYYYNITMRGYNLNEISNSDSVQNVESQESMLAKLGLDGVKGSSFLTSAKKFATQGRDILGSVANGVNQLGR